jgi:K(+)-stimulated pyrophosphate-energized sodium pump
MRIMMVVASGVSYLINDLFARARYGDSRDMDFEHPLKMLIWLTSLISILCTFGASYLLIANLGGGIWWMLASIITCGTLAAAIVPEVTTFFTSTHSRHVQEIVTASREGGASLNILSGLTAGNFSSFWVGGIVMVALMAIAYAISTLGLARLMTAEAVQEWADCLPDARILKLDGVGHHPALEDPDRFFPALDTFLAGRWPEGATRRLM